MKVSATVQIPVAEIRASAPVAQATPEIAAAQRETFTLCSSQELAKPCAPMPAATGPNRSWEDDILYFAMTDRFANGDKTNDVGTDPSNPQRLHGGDWQGIIDNLDEIKKVGATALWISPVQQNDRNFMGMDGYHGYWPNDFHKTEPAFGDMDKLKELVEKAHEKGMKVVIDLVLNHTGYNHPWANDPEKKEWFHDNKLSFKDDMEKGSLFGLPDLAQEKPMVEDYLIEMGKFWARETNCDGFRLDAIMHFPAEFQQKFTDAMKKERGENFFLLGEAYTGGPERINEFQEKGKMDSVYDFPFNEVVRNVAGRNEDMSWALPKYLRFRELMKEDFIGEAYRVRNGKSGAEQLHDLFAKDSIYKNPRMLTTLVENHDMPRFLEAAGPRAKDKFKQALALEFCARGIPLLYYGAEDSMGLKKGDCRADKRSGDDPEMQAYVQQLTSLRQSSVALRRGEQKELYYDKDTYAFARVHDEQTIVVASNFDKNAHLHSLPMPDSDLKLVDRITGKTYESQGDRLDVEIPASGTLVLEVVGKVENPKPRPEMPQSNSWLDWIPFFHPKKA
jgi:glycosidase